MSVVNPTATRMLTTLVILPFLLLTACGGGSGGGGSGGDPNPQTGYFVDAPVQGLKYRTPTQAGETGSDGAFLYRGGETVSFYLGDILIGQAAGAARLSPFDLAGISVPPRTAIETRHARNAIDGKYATPFEVVINIAVFLQTLDEDGDLSTGIQIPAQMHTLATGVSIDFNQDRRTFYRDFPFRQLIATGRDAGLWGGSRPIRNPGYALDSLYAGLGITPVIHALSQFEADDNADGITDRRETYTYDANGQRILIEYDQDADGTVDSRETYAHDANGNTTRFAYDADADGIMDGRYTYGYDANGNQILLESDKDSDGATDARTIYGYDAPATGP